MVFFSLVVAIVVAAVVLTAADAVVVASDAVAAALDTNADAKRIEDDHVETVYYWASR